jgi:hypothetical protein
MSDTKPDNRLFARRLLRILGQRAIGATNGSDLVRWAEQALEGGDDFLMLRVIAGLSSPVNEFELDQYVRQLYDEIGVAGQFGDQLLLEYAQVLAADVLACAISIEEGTRRLRDVALRTRSPTIINWIYLEEELDRSNFRGSGIQDVEAKIRLAATRLLESNATR